MTWNDANERGIDRGRGIAELMDIPTIGQKIDQYDLENFEGTIKTLADCETVFKDMCYASETNARQFTPFEFTAKEINDHEEFDAADLWGAFDEGITEAIDDYWDKTVSLWYDKNPVILISQASGGGYDISVIPSEPRISEYSLNMCNARGKADILSSILIESHKDSAEVIVID